MNETGIQALGQLARTVTDLAASVAWYRDVLGLGHLYTFGNMAFFACGETRLMLVEKSPPLPDESSVYLRVADIDGAYAALQSNGVQFTGAPHMIYRHDDGTEEWMAFFEDLQARPVAIMATVPGPGVPSPE